MKAVLFIIRVASHEQLPAIRTTCATRWLALLLLLTLPAVVEAQCGYKINNGTVTITEYTHSGGVVVIPDWSDGYPARLYSIRPP